MVSGDIFLVYKRCHQRGLAHFYKIIGIVLGVVFVLNLVVVVYFGWKFPDNAPYSSEDWYMWTGYGLAVKCNTIFILLMSNFMDFLRFLYGTSSI